jgi:hypothetical protein
MGHLPLCQCLSFWEVARYLHGRSLGTGTTPAHNQVMGQTTHCPSVQGTHSCTALAGLMKQGRSTHHAVWTRCWLRSHSNTWRYITIIWKIWVRQLLPRTSRAGNSDLVDVHAAKEPHATSRGWLLVTSGRWLSWKGNFCNVLATYFWSWALFSFSSSTLFHQWEISLP